MQKIISLFQRNYDGDRLVRDEIVPGAEWVQAGEGVATMKFDGTCCLVHDANLFKRYEVKRGKTPPENFEPAGDMNAKTGKQQGWVPVGDGPDDQWHREAWKRFGFVPSELVTDGRRWHMQSHSPSVSYFAGTFELIGPKIEGNPEHQTGHCLVPHGCVELLHVPRDFDGLRQYLSENNIKGIVWHHADGRMVKIKGKDFGIKRCNH